MNPLAFILPSNLLYLGQLPSADASTRNPDRNHPRLAGKRGAVQGSAIEKLGLELLWNGAIRLGVVVATAQSDQNHQQQPPRAPALLEVW